MKKLEDYGDVLTVNDLYELLPVGMNAVRHLVNSGKIRSIKIGNKYVIPKTAIKDFLGQTA